MAQLREVPTPVPPGAAQPSRRRLPGWCRRPFTSLWQAWRNQMDLWERWYTAPYKDAGPLRWQRRDGRWVLDGAEMPRVRKVRSRQKGSP